MTAVTTVGRDPERIDIEVCPGEPVDFTAAVTDANGDPQSLAGWTLSATAYRDQAEPDLHVFTTAVVGTGVQVYASPAQTTVWANWTAPTVRWSLWLTPPASPPYLFAAGWVRLTTH